jgi:formate--tetrahydrofolate ligase
MNDRALRGVVTSLGGVANGFAREGGFDITVASEVMAILCLASDLDDLQRRLGNIVIGYRRDRTPVTARDLEANGAMAVLLKDAIKPNLVQTLENNPAFVHGGPFANIAHGCNSVIATRAAGKLADYVVTEAGFGADLGAEKFLDIKCRKGGLEPDLAVLVATVRALKMHGGVARSALGGEDARAVRAGGANMARHVANLRRFGLPVVVALNKFSADTAAEVGQVFEACAELRVPVVECDHWARGGEGAIALAEEVAGQIDADGADYRPLYPDDMPLWEKMGTVARTIYGAEDVVADDNVRKRIAELQDSGYGHFPVCMAKTQYSYTADATRMGAPSGFELPIREVRLCGGAEFVIAICGEIMTMPGLPRRPAATQIRLGADGHIEGLF